MPDQRIVAITVDRAGEGFRATCDHLPGKERTGATAGAAVGALKVDVLRVVAEKGEPPFAVDFQVTVTEPEPKPEPKPEEESDGEPG